MPNFSLVKNVDIKSSAGLCVCVVRGRHDLHKIKIKSIEKRVQRDVRIIFN